MELLLWSVVGVDEATTTTPVSRQKTMTMMTTMIMIAADVVE
jgi:hypothetical protein